MEKIRLQKHLSQLGIASRREAESMIRAGLVRVNDEMPDLGALVDPLFDKIHVKGKLISERTPPKVYWLFNKPDSCITTHSDERNRKTIFDIEALRKISFKVNPVGRLDYHTEGLLLLTNDGDLHNKLCHPSTKVPRYYQVLITGKLAENQLRMLRRGIQLEDGLAQCEIQYAHGKNLGKSRGSYYFITVTEGRNRLVRRLIEHFNLKVLRLVRYGFGDLRLDESLKPGQYRQLTKPEITYLKSYRKPQNQ